MLRGEAPAPAFGAVCRRAIFRSLPEAHVTWAEEAGRSRPAARVVLPRVRARSRPRLVLGPGPRPGRELAGRWFRRIASLLPSSPAGPAAAFRPWGLVFRRQEWWIRRAEACLRPRWRACPPPGR